jgi:hypothetical protein
LRTICHAGTHDNPSAPAARPPAGTVEVRTIAGTDLVAQQKIFWDRLIREKLADVDALGDLEVPPEPDED